MTLECTEARAAGATPSRYVTQKVHSLLVLFFHFECCAYALTDSCLRALQFSLILKAYAFSDRVCKSRTEKPQQPRFTFVLSQTVLLFGKVYTESSCTRMAFFLGIA